MHRRFFMALLALTMALVLALPTALADGASGIIAQAAATAAPATADGASDADKATTAPTPKATTASTPKATTAPTPKATTAPTAKPTVAPTTAPTPVPTDVPTVEPSAIPTVEPTATPEPLPLPARQDDQGELIKQIQTRLRTLGFLTDTADGYFGPLTRAGVIAFQEFVNEYMAIQLHYVDPAEATEPTEEPTAAPTEEPTAIPSPAATPDPAATPTVAPTPEPTPEPTPYVADGIIDEAGYALLTGDDFTLYYADLQNGSEGTDVKRLQTRLTNLYYLADGIDGIFGGNTESAVKYFQKYNGLEETGVADEATQLKLYAEEAVPTAKPTLAPVNKHSKGNGKSYSKYKLVVDISDQRVYAFGYENGAYGPLARAMVCSTGTKSNPTPLGTFKGSGPSHRWHYFEKFECYAQYSWRIDGPILFHSVLYNEKEGSPTSSSVRNLGRRASHGCVRLSVDDAKWIYKNCASGTTVVVRS